MKLRKRILDGGIVCHSLTIGKLTFETWLFHEKPWGIGGNWCCAHITLFGRVFWYDNVLVSLENLAKQHQ